MNKNYILICVIAFIIGMVIRYYKTEHRVKDYKQYLKSSHWKRVRKRAYKHYKGKCMLCSSKANLQVHHNNYKCLKRERMNDLILLCSNCHNNYHTSKKYKVSNVK